MSDDFEQARQKAKLQEQQNQLSRQERDLRNDIDRMGRETPKLQQRNKVLEGKFKDYPNKPTPEQEKQYGEDTNEYRGNLAKIEKNQRELPQKKEQLQSLQLDQSKNEMGQITNAGAEKQHDRHAVTPTPTGTSKGDLKREYHKKQANPYEAKKMPMSDTKDIKDMNHENKGNQPPAKGSEHFNTAQKQAKENESKPKQPQQPTKGNENENDNER